MMKMFKKMDGDKKPKAAAKSKVKVTAVMTKSTKNSKTGAVTKSAPKKMGMKSISAKEFYK